MADSRYGCAASNLLCTETNNLCFDDLDSVATDDRTPQTSDQKMAFGNVRSEPLVVVCPLQSDDIFGVMVDREKSHLPRGDYLTRLRSGELDLSVRREAVDWIWKAHAHYRFGPLSVCLSINFLDRFLSVYDLPRGRSWTIQLLAVTCLSLATKVEEIYAPLIVDLQVGEPKFLFEGKTVQRMELLVLSTLNWKMQACTPCAFIDYFLGKINGGEFPSGELISRSINLILNTIKGIDFLEFRPSEIAAAVAMSVSGEIPIQAMDIDKAMASSVFMHVEKGRVLKCLELIKDLILISGGSATGTGVVAMAVAGTSSSSPPPSSSSVPQSPVGVLDAAASLSYKSDERTVGSCPNSSNNSPEAAKRRKLDTRASQSQGHCFKS